MQLQRQQVVAFGKPALDIGRHAEQRAAAAAGRREQVDAAEEQDRHRTAPSSHSGRRLRPTCAGRDSQRPRSIHSRPKSSPPPAREWRSPPPTRSGPAVRRRAPAPGPGRPAPPGQQRAAEQHRGTGATRFARPLSSPAGPATKAKTASTEGTRRLLGSEARGRSARRHAPAQSPGADASTSICSPISASGASPPEAASASPPARRSHSGPWRARRRRCRAPAPSAS